jgi:hypothetical protein
VGLSRPPETRPGPVLDFGPLGSSSRGCDPRRVGMFRNAEEEPMPQMIKPVAWEAVKELLIAEVRRLS